MPAVASRRSSGGLRPGRLARWPIRLPIGPPAEIRRAPTGAVFAVRRLVLSVQTPPPRQPISQSCPSFDENQLAVASDLQAIDFFLVPDLDLPRASKEVGRVED